MVVSKKGILKSRKGQSVMAFVDSSIGVTIENEVFCSTVRASDCDIVISKTSGPRCTKCVQYRSSLRSSYANYIKPKNIDAMTSTSSHINLRYLCTPQRSTRALRRKAQIGIKSRRIKALEEKLQYCINEKGVDVDSDLNDGLLDLMKSISLDGNESFHNGSLKKIFWEQQLKVASVKNKRQIRWHPLIIKWCLSMKLSSSAAYRAMRETGFITLPSEHTLCDYTHIFKAKPGRS